MKILVSCITLLTIALTYHHVAGQFTRPPISTITDCEGSVFDIVFVLDSSGSVGYDNFTVMKSFVKAVVQNLEIADNKTRVGLMTYSRYPFIRINLQDYSNKTELLEAVDQVPYIPGITETQSALELLLQEGFKGDRPYAPHVGVVVTDGKSFHTNQTASAAEAARQSGITLIAVGIGTEINTAELNSIASDPDSQHVFTVSNFASLHQIVTTLTAKACNATALTPPITTQLPTSPTTQLLITKVNETSENCNRTLADLVFVLDSSGSLGFENFNKVKQFAIDIVNYLDIGPNFTKVGVITYSNYPNRRFKLDSYTDKLQLVNAINQIPYYPGNTETDKALDMLRLEGFEGDRPNAPNIAIIVTDGLSTNPGLTKISASQVKNGGITVFAVGIGAEIDTAELKYISSDPDNQYVFFVGNFSSLPTIESTVARTTCNVKLVTTMPTPTTQSTTTTTTTRMTTPSCTARVADVMFVLDTSGSVGPDNFLQIKHFVKQTISVFDIATDFTRVGIITYSTNADIAFPLNTYNTTASLNAAIDGIVFTHGGTNTGAALELLRTKGFQYDRDDAPNIAIVMTDGLSKDKINTKLQATLAKNNNITIIAIGVGNSTDQEELNNLATFDVLNNRNLVYQVGDFAALDTLNSTVATVACGFVLPENLPTTTPPPQTIPGCHDTIPNCDEYGSDICYDYKPWAEAHCAARCGFCVGPTTTAPVCENRLNNCHEYGTYICTTSSLIAWTKKNCAQYCGICANGSIPTEPPINPQVLTTQSQQPCVDLRDNCNEYGGKAMCSDPQYRGWSHKNCYKYCGYCITTITETKVNNVTCPAWELPSACTMSTTDGTCCPFPICPDGYLLTAKAP